MINWKVLASTIDREVRASTKRIMKEEGVLATTKRIGTKEEVTARDDWKRTENGEMHLSYSTIDSSSGNILFWQHSFSQFQWDVLQTVELLRVHSFNEVYWYKSAAILTCKSIVKLGHRGERLIEWSYLMLLHTHQTNFACCSQIYSIVTIFTIEYICCSDSFLFISVRNNFGLHCAMAL